METPALLLSLRAPPPPPPSQGAPKSRVVYDFPAETLVRYMHLRQDEAAKALGVATITLKRICHRRKIKWTYRAYKTQKQRQAKAKRLAEIEFDAEELQRTRRTVLPYMYLRPVRADVPTLATRLVQVQYSTQRPKLPSLAETLGSPVSSYPRVPFPAKQRPHLPMPSDQPRAEPAPLLPRLNVVKTTAIFSTPTYAIKSPKPESAPAFSPSKARFGLLPSIDSGRLVPRAIGHI